MNPYQNWEKMFKDAIQYDVPQLKVGEKIVFLGIGGSGIVGRVLQIIELPIELEVYRGFKVKSSKNSSIIVVSYSGETTETLIIKIDAKKKKSIYPRRNIAAKYH